MEIKTVALIGLGGLGIAFGECLLGALPGENLRVVASEARVARYRRQGVTSNGRPLQFHFVTPGQNTGPADLALFMVKGPALDGAIEEMRGQVGPGTILLSALNGISSEERLAAAFGGAGLVYCVAQGMDVKREGSGITFKNRGMLCIGDPAPGPPSESLRAVAALFARAGLPYQVVADMKAKMWGKFMLNVGVNQVATVTKGSYGSVSRPGPALDTMLGAMGEVQALAPHEGVTLTDEDVAYWVDVVRGLDPDGYPSMRQDALARRETEVELFAGTVLALGKKHGVDTPVNRMLYEEIRKIEAGYGLKYKGPPHYGR